MFDEVDALLHEDELEVAGLVEPLSSQLALSAIEDLDAADTEMHEVPDDLTDTIAPDPAADDVDMIDGVIDFGLAADEDEGEQPVDAIVQSQLYEHDGTRRQPAEHLEDNVIVTPRRSEEFVCRICFLVRPRWQLADDHALVCRDCA